MLLHAHEGIGTAVVLGFLILVILNAATLLTQSTFNFQRYIAYLAALLLLVQYILGFALLGKGFEITPAHYILALLAIITVGLEHGYANQRVDPRNRTVMLLSANVGTLILVAIAYLIGTSSVG